jgi:DNA repair photolyase
MFTTKKRFVDAGVSCGVNVDPILPLITDSKEELELILDSCKESGVKYVFGAVLRLRADIWQRMITILMSLDIEHGVDEYERIYQFTKPLKPGYNINANECYSTRVLQDLKQRISERGMIFDFPAYMRNRQINGSHVRDVIHRMGPGQQLTLMKYM